MSGRPGFSLSRLAAMIVKEFTQMRRDKLTFAMILGIPIIELLLFAMQHKVPQTKPPARQVAHRYAPFNTRAIAEVRRSQFSSSAVSCLRPAFVSE